MYYLVYQRTSKTMPAGCLISGMTDGNNIAEIVFYSFFSLRISHSFYQSSELEVSWLVTWPMVRVMTPIGKEPD